MTLNSQPPPLNPPRPPLIEMDAAVKAEVEKLFNP
jgi:hypothetical protein